MSTAPVSDAVLQNLDGSLRVGRAALTCRLTERHHNASSASSIRSVPRRTCRPLFLRIGLQIAFCSAGFASSVTFAPIHR
jgi:hypothetical protein